MLGSSCTTEDELGNDDIGALKSRLGNKQKTTGIVERTQGAQCPTSVEVPGKQFSEEVNEEGAPVFRAVRTTLVR